MTSLLGKDVPLSDAFLRMSFLPKLQAWGIALAVNVTGATHAQCADHPERLGDEVAAIQRLLDLGADISFLSLQSPLSKVSGVVPSLWEGDRVRPPYRRYRPLCGHHDGALSRC